MGRTRATAPPSWQPSSQLQDQVKNIVIRLTSAQILALNATPVILIPPPGAGYVWLLWQTVALLTPGGTQYANGSDIVIGYGVTAANYQRTICTTATVLSATDAFDCRLPELATEANQPPVNITNQPLYCKASAAAFINGDGTLLLSLAVLRVKLF